MERRRDDDGAGASAMVRLRIFNDNVPRVLATQTCVQTDWTSMNLYKCMRHRPIAVLASASHNSNLTKMTPSVGHIILQATTSIALA